ncbi:hypothetical protein COCNU_scaffold013737G000030 [Cocos nucifera]|nr:hypothetical protein [Cocos nucifera]
MPAHPGGHRTLIRPARRKRGEGTVTGVVVEPVRVEDRERVVNKGFSPPTTRDAVIA